MSDQPVSNPTIDRIQQEAQAEIGQHSATDALRQHANIASEWLLHHLASVKTARIDFDKNELQYGERGRIETSLAILKNFNNFAAFNHDVKILQESTELNEGIKYGEKLLTEFKSKTKKQKKGGRKGSVESSSEPSDNGDNS